MRISAYWGVLFGVGLCASAFAQPQLILDSPGGTTLIPQGGQITIELFVNNISPEKLRAYQATLEFVPTPGATGSIVLAPADPAPSADTKIQIDTLRSDFVFAGFSVFPGTNRDLLQVGATLILPSDSVEVFTRKYLGDYTLQASLDASGDFQIRFLLIDPDNVDRRPTQLVDQNGLQLSFNTVPIGGLTVSVFSIAPNDSCSQSLVINDGVTLFSNENTTTDGPDHPFTTCDVNGTSQIQNDIWFEYTASCSGIIAASTCGTADFDTRIAIYDGCTCPVSGANLLACNDDAVSCGSTSEAVFGGVFQGSCYKVRVGGSGNVSGSGSLLLTCIGNDSCGNAEPLTSGVTVQGSTRNTAINDTATPLCGGPVDSPGVWYSMTGTGGLFTAALSSSSFDSRISVYQGTCSSLTCVTDVDNPGGSQETASWCATAGVKYFLLIHSNSGQTGTFTLRLDDTSCDDSSVCTADSCEVDTCVNAPLFDDTAFCCAPGSGNLTPIDDDNPCTIDTCNALTGQVTHSTAPNGPEPACDDGLTCTFDACQNGTCINTDINTISCQFDSNCPGDSICISNTCFCDSTPTLTLIPESSGVLQVEGCFVVGDTVSVRVDLGPAGVTTLTPTDIVGVQFFLSYDNSTLDFLSIVPGATVDPNSPFALVFNNTTDEINGTIDYVVGATLGSGTRSPATVALITFQAISECSAFTVFRPSGPNGESNLLTLAGGVVIDPLLIDLNIIQISNAPPSISACPANILTPPDPGQITAAVSWVNPTGSNSCSGGAVLVNCLPFSGSVFPAGSTTVTCTAIDSCEREASCSFTVTVETPILTTDIQLSPTLTSGTIDRCITFELWDCDAVGGPQNIVIEQTISFTSGQALGVSIPMPGGGWDCLTARDALHTLRNTANDFFTANGIDYSATFVGPRSSGGDWLLGGNLNDDRFIDIVDFAIFFPVYLTPATGDTPCGSVGPHPNINGDNVVDLLDLVYISGNSLFASEPGCCGGTLASSAGPRTFLTLDEARRMGLGDLSPFDKDQNGIFDYSDVAAIIGNAADLLKFNDPDGHRGLGLSKKTRKGPRTGR